MAGPGDDDGAVSEATGREPLSSSDRIAERFAAWVRRRSDDQLASVMAGWKRRALLWGIFRITPRRLSDEEARGESAVIEIRIRHPRRQPDRWQLLIARGRCRASRRPFGESDSEITFDGADFLRFIAGQISPIELFRARRINIDGSLVLASQLPAMFQIDSGAGRD